MKSDLHETFRIGSWGSPKMIQYVKDDPILQVTSQEPSASSKYDLKDGGFLRHFYLNQMKSDLHKTFMKCSRGSPKMIQHVKDDPILQVSSQEPSPSYKYDFEDGGVLEALLNILES